MTRPIHTAAPSGRYRSAATGLKSRISPPRKLIPLMSPSVARIFALACLLAVSTSHNAATAADSYAEFEKLEQQYQQAKTKADFVAVASGYETLIKPTSTSVSVLFNQANAWLKAEEFGRAIVGYRRALMLAPADSAIRGNLKLAIDKAGHTTEPSTAIDYAFFWKDSLTLTSLAMLITVFILAASALFLINRSSPLRQVAFPISLIVICVLIASFAVKINDEQLTVRGAIIVDSSDAKKGPAASYESAFSSPLTDGLEFTVAEQQQDWVKVEIAGIGTGWVPESDVALY